MGTSPTVELNDVVRPLGAFEQVFHLYSEHNPTHFSLSIRVAGLTNPQAEHQLPGALARLRDVHPQLSVCIVDRALEGNRPQTALFRRTELPVPIAVEQPGTAGRT